MAPERTRIEALCDGVIEAGWLVSLAVSPLYFNPYTNRSFEPDKIALLKVVILVMAGAWVVKTSVLRGLKMDGSPTWREASLPLAVVAVVTSAIVSSIASIDPQLSVWGSYHRAQGTLTLLCYVAVFALAAGHLRRAEQWRRVMFVVVITATAVSLYALMQFAGTDPFVSSKPISRTSSTLGNPIFLGGYLLMTILVSIQGLADSVRNVLRASIDESIEARFPAAAITRTGFFLFAVACQLTAFVRAGSRGPLVGLLSGLFVFCLLSALRSRPVADRAHAWSIWRRRVARWSWVAVLAVAALSLFLLLGSTPIDDSGETGARAHRFAHTFDTESRTAHFRLILWGTVVDMMASSDPVRIQPEVDDALHPVRWLIGYGPETLNLSLNRVLSRELIRSERRGAVPDRAHNGFLDRLAETGAFGLLAWIWLWGSVFQWCIEGLAPSRVSRRPALLWLTILSAVPIAVVVAASATGSWRWSGLAAPVGLIVAGVSHAAIALVNSTPKTHESPEARWRSRLAVVIMAIMIAHLVESSFSLTTVSTNLLFWFFAAAALALQRGDESVQDHQSPAADGPTTGLVTAIICSTLVIDLVGAAAPDSPTIIPTAAWRWLMLTWVAALIMFLSGRVRRPSGLSRDAMAFVAASAVPTLITVALLRWWLRGTSPIHTTQGVDSLTWLGIGSAWVLLAAHLTLGATIDRASRRPFTRSESDRGSWTPRDRAAAAALILIIAGAFAAVPRMFRPLRADVLAKHAIVALDTGSPNHAVELSQRAVELAPTEDAYLSLEARALSAMAIVVTDDRRALAYLEDAEENLVRAVEVRPLNPEHVANLARLRIRLSERQDSGERRALYHRQAEAGFERALELRPGSAEYLAGLGGLLMRRGELESAALTLEEAVRRDDRYLPAVIALAGCHTALADEADSTGASEVASNHRRVARRVVERALQSAPDSERLRTLLAELE